MKAWGFTDTGKVREQNQDAYCIKAMNENSLLCVVCDGMGGAKAGNVASALACETFMDAAAEALAQDAAMDGQTLLTEAAQKANSAVFHRAAVDADCLGMGTTMVAAYIAEDRVFFANVGDSRGYLVTGGVLSRVTRDHSLVEDLVQKGEITPEQARVHPQKNLITRAMGSEHASTPDFYQLPRREGDLLLLCTDGLSNLLTEQELQEELLSGVTLEASCDHLLQLALSRGAPDNVTGVLIAL